MNNPSETICAIATPPGEGALGIVRLSGPRALSLLGELCRKRFEPRRLQLARLIDPEDQQTIDQVLVCTMPAPRSYTGEDVVEIQGHGGVFNMNQILAAFIRRGARLAGPGEFTRRAFINGRMDLTQAEGVAQIIAARGSGALKNAQALLGGELGQRIRALREDAVNIAAQLEARIDFAEDVGDDELGLDPLLSRHQELERRIAALADTYHSSRRYEGLRVALVGQVNAGKSSLFNQLLGTTRALVSEEQGTTRDYLDAEVVWGGHPITLIDTVGARPEAQMSSMERAGQEITAPIIQESDLVLEVIDLSASSPEGQLSSRFQDAMTVGNKMDLVPEGQRQVIEQVIEKSVGRRLVSTSALTGEGLVQLKEAILTRLLPAGAEPETVMVARKRQWEALCRAARAIKEGREALESGVVPEVAVEHLREALSALGEVTGETFTESVLDHVFGEFCVGK